MMRIQAGDIHLLHLQTRMPFKYGIATMTRTPHAFVRMRLETAGRISTGIAADVLPPKWFTKNPERDIHDEVLEMAQVIQHAVQLAIGLEANTVFELWQKVWAAQDAWGRQQKLPPLLVHFGTSLVERGLIEAFCRHAHRPFWQLLRDNAFGMRLGSIHAELASHEPSEFLPSEPLAQITARHTIGLADPLQDTDIAAADRLNDGLPQSLSACIGAYGLRHFKIKVVGNIDKDRDRLRRIAAIIDAHAPAQFAFSLDGNEQFHAAVDFIAYWNELVHDRELQDFFQHLLFVEQPFHRNQALDLAAVKSLHDWTQRPPLIIDESDAELSSLPTALQLGYSGTSHKNCKGVFKGVANACLLAALRKQGRTSCITSGEDLANIGPIALLQDLAVCAALGIASVERNGHHYFAGLSMFPKDVQQNILTQHDDLYHASPNGWPTLRIEHGSLRLTSINNAPFGVGFELNVEQFQPFQKFDF